MPLLIQNRGLDCITSTAELFDKYPHLQVCIQEAWLISVNWDTVSGVIVVCVCDSYPLIGRATVNDEASWLLDVWTGFWCDIIINQGKHKPVRYVCLNLKERNVSGFFLKFNKWHKTGVADLVDDLLSVIFVNYFCSNVNFKDKFMVSTLFTKSFLSSV